MEVTVLTVQLYTANCVTVQVVWKRLSNHENSIKLAERDYLDGTQLKISL